MERERARTGGRRKKGIFENRSLPVDVQYNNRPHTDYSLSGIPGTVMHVLNGLLIFSVKWTAPICCLPRLCWVGNVILQGHMWEQFKIRMKRESVKSELIWFY